MMRLKVTSAGLKELCECSDKGCPCHEGLSQCSNIFTTILYRIDMDDLSGTYFCPACADDAMESGLFTDAVVDGVDDDAEVSNG